MENLRKMQKIEFLIKNLKLYKLLIFHEKKKKPCPTPEYYEVFALWADIQMCLIRWRLRLLQHSA